MAFRGGGRGITARFTAIGARVRRKVGGIESILQSIDSYAEGYMNGVKEDLQIYPDEPENSTYTRTFELQRSWKVKRSQAGGNISYVLSNDAQDPRGRSYASYVQGTLQTRQHEQTGWERVDEASRRRDFQYGIQKIITQGLGEI